LKGGIDGVGFRGAEGGNEEDCRKGLNSQNKCLISNFKLILALSPPLRHNCNLDITHLAYYLLHNCFREPFPPGARATPPHKNLRDAMSAGEIGDTARYILALYDVRLDPQVAREAHVPLYGCVHHGAGGYVDG